MYEKITEYARMLDEKSRARRRDFHKHPEMAWYEMRTSAIIAKTLTELGYDDVLTGKEVCLESARMGVPSEEELQAHAREAIAWGAPEEYLTDEMKEGYTGVIGILHCGEGPVVALRFDIDCLGMREDATTEHRPYREGFASEHLGWMHACGHDGHTAIGLGLAHTLKQFESGLHGVIKLIFQPAEEGTRGARAMVDAGVVDDVDYFTAVHIGTGVRQ